MCVFICNCIKKGEGRGFKSVTLETPELISKSKFIFRRIKKKAKTEGKKLSHYNYVKSGKADKAYMKNSPHVPLRQNAEEKR
jgi:hypothetical protein